MRQHRGRNERCVLELHAVVNLVTFAKTSQNRNGVLDVRFAHQHRLEAALEGCVLFDVLPVFVECRGADGVQLATRKHRLQHLRRVHCAFCGACTDHRVQFVDEENDLTLGVGDLLEDGLQPFLELAPILRPGHERSHVEREDLLVLEPFRHVAADDPLGKPFHDGSLADAGLADEHGIVLGATREHLDHAAHFLVTADHRVELALAGEIREVAPIAGERLVGGFRVL